MHRRAPRLRFQPGCIPRPGEEVALRGGNFAALELPAAAKVKGCSVGTGVQKLTIGILGDYGNFNTLRTLGIDATVSF